MALGRQGERQSELMVGWAELPRSPGHIFYDRLQAVLIEAGFDGFAETQCAPYYTLSFGGCRVGSERLFPPWIVGEPAKLAWFGPVGAECLGQGRLELLQAVEDLVGERGA